MAGLKFDDLPDEKNTGAITFDDLPDENQRKKLNPADVIIPENKGSLSAFTQALTGGTIPYGNRITSAIGAASIAPFVDETYSQLYKQAMADTRATEEANPGATIAGNVLGIAETLPIAFSKIPEVTGVLSGVGRGVKYAADTAGKMVSASPFKGSGIAAGAGNLAAKMVGGAAVAAPTFGLYSAGNAEPGQQMEAFKSGAGMGAAIGAALPVAGAVLGSAAAGSKNIYKGITARGEDALNDSLSIIKQGSRNLYNYADQAGVLVKPESAKELVDSLTGVIKSKDIASQRLYSGTIGAIKDLVDDVAAGNTGLMTLDRHRQILNNIAKDITNPNKAQEAEAASRVIGVIDDFIDGLSDKKLLSGTPEAISALRAARSEWAKSKKFEKISNIIIGAKNDANKLKRDLNSFRANPKNTLGWTAEERKALDFAADQTVGEGLIKMAGKFGFDLGSGRSIGNTALPILGGAGAGLASGTFAPAGVVIAAGTTARAAQKGLALGKAEDLLKVIESGGKISMEAIDALPQSEKKAFLSRIMKMPVAQAKTILKDVKNSNFGKEVSRYIKDESGSVKFHGSPHLFDKLDISKIGTGEGSQANGWGLYLADSIDTADNYRTAGFFRSGSDLKSNPEKLAVSVIQMNGGTGKAIEKLESVLSGKSSIGAPLDVVKDALRLIKQNDPSLGKIGNVYSVDLPDTANVLLMHKNMSEQPQSILRALKNAGVEYNKENTGLMLYNDLSQKLGGKKEASMYLSSLGVDGMKYLDKVDGTTNKEMFNYIIFNDKILGKANRLLKAIESGGKISMEEVNKLPTPEKNKVMKYIMNLPAPLASRIFSKQGKGVIE